MYFVRSEMKVYVRIHMHVVNFIELVRQKHFVARNFQKVYKKIYFLKKLFVKFVKLLCGV